jgi:hypothetical protein
VPALLLIGLAAGLAAGPAAAQPPPGETPVQRPKKGASKSTYNPGLDRDRFEFGVAGTKGYFDVLGTFGYRLFLRERVGWIQTLQTELTGSNQGYLSEGSGSVYYLLRPLAWERPGWRVRPVLEGGFGAHLVVQAADIEGMNETSYHAHAYVKAHLYAGLELLASERLGLVVRGRLSAPSHRPADYAQAAIFLR